MCQLFAASAKYPIEWNEQLKEFYSHSSEHPHGWGLAVMDGKDVFIEKEPVQATKSGYLKARLSVPVTAQTTIAHIRYATIGNVEYRNCHPYTGTDISGRRWTMAHNGTIFDFPELSKFTKTQQGDTDSERILLYLLEEIDKAFVELGRNLTAEERFALLEDRIAKLSKGNKLNLLLWDGEFLYVHSNYHKGLHINRDKDQVIVCTVPLEHGIWKELKVNTLMAFKNGLLARKGEDHGNTYVDNEEDMKYLYQIFSSL